VEMGDGRVAGAMLENGFLEKCGESDIEAHLLTPGARFEPFVARYRQEGVRFSYLSAEDALRGDRSLARLNAFGERLNRYGFHQARQLLWSFAGERISARNSGEVGRIVEAERPGAVVACNGSIGFDLGMIARARRLGIPTLGNVFSWDHPFRVQKARPDRLTCWSGQVREWLVEHAGFQGERIEVIGAPAFDGYFGRGSVCTRKELADQLGLDPGRPILVFATLGQMRQMIDETAPFRALMAAIDEGRISGNPQVILRLHPLSVDYYFEDFRNRPDVVFSRFKRYCPGMRWWPSGKEVALAGNILRHADVCLSPGSTMAIEPSIFDTPTLIPVFNQYTTDEFREFFDIHWMNKHFRFLKARNLLPFAFSEDEMIDGINRFLEEPSWMADGREAIRRELLGPLDGGATGRFVDAIAGMLQERA